MMRTTVTLDPDTEAAVRRLMGERGLTFKQALNDAIRAGVLQRPVQAYTQVRSLGRPTVNLDRALTLAAELEDDDLIAKIRAGK